MRVLLDTNIVLDYLGANQGFTEDAEKVFDLAAKRKDIKLVSSSAITDIKDGAEETVLKTARATLRSRLLTRFVGDRYAVFVLTPVGRHVEAVEVREAIVSDRE
jgi:predicted nucleic acid-binding protein